MKGKPMTTTEVIEKFETANRIRKLTIQALRATVHEIENANLETNYIDIAHTRQILDNLQADYDKCQARIDEIKKTDPAPQATNYGMARLSAALRFKEPALTGGQLINRILDADKNAPEMPVYYYDFDENYEDKYERITNVGVYDGKIIIY